MGSEGYHEPLELLPERTRNLHRAIVTLIEELEAIDWYQQRAEACSDRALVAVLVHNRNEEIEHAMMTLEWIRRHCHELDAQARKFLFSTGEITAREDAGDAASVPDDPEAADHDAGGSAGTAVPTSPAAGRDRRAESLGIGSLRLEWPHEAG
jgi:ferritin-like protein